MLSLITRNRLFGTTFVTEDDDGDSDRFSSQSAIFLGSWAAQQGQLPKKGSIGQQGS